MCRRMYRRQTGQTESAALEPQAAVALLGPRHRQHLRAISLLARI